MKKRDISIRLKSHFQTASLKNRVVSFSSFNGPFVAHKIPVVILCDSLMRPEIYFDLVEKVLKDRPFYILDLCSFIVDYNENLDNQKMTDFVVEWLDVMGIEKVIMLGMGLSFQIAQRFAQTKPHRCDKLIVGGATPAVRDSVRLLILEQIQKFDFGEVNSFAKGLSYIFSNYNFKDRIDRSESYRSLFEYTIRKMTPSMQMNLKSDLLRFLECNTLAGSIECPTLIIEAEYDSVTTINEGLQFSKRCLQSQLAIIECLDHLAPVQNMRVITRLLRRFLSDEPLNRMTGVELYTKKSLPLNRLQMTPRYQFEQFGFLDSGNGVLIPIQVMDINRNGCRLFTTFTEHKDLIANRNFTLSIPERDLKLEVILFSTSNSGELKGVFVHRNSDQFKKLNDAIEMIAMEFDECPIVA